MTKLWVISDYQRDLIGEVGFFMPENGLPDADVLVVAGDFHPPLSKSVAALGRIAKTIPVVYVPGNRDFYSQNTIGEELAEARRVAESIAGAGFYILDNEDVVVAGARFVGATLWTDLEFDGGLQQSTDFLSNDFRAISVADPSAPPAGSIYLRLKNTGAAILYRVNSSHEPWVRRSAAQQSLFLIILHIGTQSANVSLATRMA